MSTCHAQHVVQKTEESEIVAAPQELLDEPYLYQMTQHLYRWYMDESDVLHVSGDTNFTYWVRSKTPELDEGDRSRLADVIMPEFGFSVRLKCADYTIEETGVVVSNEVFKIVNVSKIVAPDTRPPGYSEKVVSYKAMRDYLFKERLHTVFPEGAVLDRLSNTVRKKLHDDARYNDEPPPDGEQIVYLSPVSPMANELWVFWETGRLLLHFYSDIELMNPAMWEHDKLGLNWYDVDEQVVVSMSEVAGSNAYLTRDQVGRALYNCIILGRRLTLNPQD